MSGRQDKFTIREIIDLLDQNYGILSMGRVQTFCLSQILMLNKLILIVNWLK
jgi:hypothetical protein